MKNLKIKSLLLSLISLIIIFSCSTIDVKKELEKEIQKDLNTAVSSIKDTSYLLKKPYWKIKRFDMVSGTLISYVAIVDLFYLDTNKLPYFQRIVYRYNEPKKRWERHRKYMLKISLANESGKELDKYITDFNFKK